MEGLINQTGKLETQGFHSLQRHTRNTVSTSDFLPCSTTLVENSSLRVSCEQLEPDEDGRGSELGVWSESGVPPPAGSIPTTGTKPASSPKSMDAHTGSRSILSCEVGQTISFTRPFETLAAGELFQLKNEQLKAESGSEHFRSTAPKMSPYCKLPEQLD